MDKFEQEEEKAAKRNKKYEKQQRKIAEFREKRDNTVARIDDNVYSIEQRLGTMEEKSARVNQSLGILTINAVKDKQRMIAFEEQVSDTLNEEIKGNNELRLQVENLQRQMFMLMNERDERLKKEKEREEESSSSSDDDPFEQNPKNYGNSLGYGLFD